MFRTTIQNVTQKRTIRPLYAATQATPWAGYLDTAWNRSVDIYPGMVMAKLQNEVWTLASNNTHRGFGLSALFVAPSLQIDEVRLSGTNLFTVWVGGQDSAFEILAPAFDTTADWTQPTNGTEVSLTHTLTAHSKGPGLLTPVGTANAATAVIAKLVSVVGTSKIIVRFTGATV
jgi:hypothetical protein